MCFAVTERYGNKPGGLRRAPTTVWHRFGVGAGAQTRAQCEYGMVLPMVVLRDKGQ